MVAARSPTAQRRQLLPCSGTPLSSWWTWWWQWEPRVSCAPCEYAYMYLACTIDSSQAHLCIHVISATLDKVSCKCWNVSPALAFLLSCTSNKMTEEVSDSECILYVDHWNWIQYQPSNHCHLLFIFVPTVMFVLFNEQPTPLLVCYTHLTCVCLAKCGWVWVGGCTVYWWSPTCAGGCTIEYWIRCWRWGEQLLKAVQHTTSSPNM